MMQDQTDTIRFLSDPATHGGGPVERIDTHISHVFLGPRGVFKLKRALRTNFLDFSTPARREAMCRREMEVNAVAGDLYRGVRAVTRGPDGALRLDGPGEPVDWVVEMARFDSGSEFDRLARDGRLDGALIEALADTVAGMHAAAPVHRGAGEAAALADRLVQIAGAVAEAGGGGALAEAAARWQQAAEGARAALALRIEGRGRHGFVRRCHGDLHLGNICLWRGRPTPFDAIEFNEAIATTDILYDAAFAVMDLLEHGLPALAGIFQSRYLSATRDHAGLALMPLFVSMRAAVRAIPAAAAEPDLAARRLRFAEAVLAPRPAPVLVAVGGPSGSGKSTLARALAPALGGKLPAVILRSDVIRKRLLGLSPEAHLAAAAYAPDIGRRVYARMLAEARRTLRAGFPAVLDAAFLNPAQQAQAGRLAAGEGVALHGFWLSAPAAVMVERISARHGDASDATPAVLAQQLAAHPDAPGWTHLDASRPPAAVAAAALAVIGAGPSAPAGAQPSAR